LISVTLLMAASALGACSSGSGNSTGQPSSRPSSGQVTAKSVDRPSWATPERFVGSADPGERVAIQVHLRLRDEAGAEAELAAISNPKSARYGQFLSAEEFARKYAPTADDVAAVRAHLEDHGLTIAHVPGNHAYVAATGTVSQVENAFSTHIGKYSVNGEVRSAPVQSPVIPEGLRVRVLGTLGLSTPTALKPLFLRAGKKPGTAPVPKDFAGPQPCSEWYGANADTIDPPYGAPYPPLSYAVCGYKPGQLRRAYGFDRSIRTGNDGTGQTVAVVDAYLSPTLKQDVQTYAAQNDPDYPLDDSQFSIVQAPGTPTPPIPGWDTEQTLDVEAVHAMAPGANIVAVVAQSQSDVDLVAAVNTVIDQQLANIVSNSYETQEEMFLTQALIWKNLSLQAGLKGVGLYFSSGDSGDLSFFFGQPTLQFPGSLATVTSVGGTSLALGRDDQVLWETGWESGESFLAFPGPVVGSSSGGGSGGSSGGSSGSAPGDDGGSFDGGDDGGPIEGGPLPDAGEGGPAPQPVWTPGGPGFFAYGAGGGQSIIWDEPAYQQGVVPVALSNGIGGPARVAPDVGMLADPGTGFLIGQTLGPGGDGFDSGFFEFPIGGTSVASPLFAGVMALAQQNAGRAFGFANPVLYNAAQYNAFRDIQPLASPQVVTFGLSGSATTFDYPNQSIRTLVGFDEVTGLGAPNGASFLGAVK
jgi:subtilase family serine protease